MFHECRFSYLTWTIEYNNLATKQRFSNISFQASYYKSHNYINFRDYNTYIILILGIMQIFDKIPNLFLILHCIPI